jgi:hypothetical protein
MVLKIPNVRPQINSPAKSTWIELAKKEMKINAVRNR